MRDPARLLVDHLDIWTGAIARKSGAGRGNGGKISLYGIDKLRSLILDLAVRGKLVPQDPAEGDGHILADHLIRLAASQPIQGKKKTSKGADWELAALNYEVPSNWTSISLSKLVRVVNGRAYKKSEFKNEGTPILRVGNLFTSDTWFYSDLELDDDKYCDAGDLIYAWSASFGPFIWSGPKVIYHYHIWKLPFISEHDVDKHFLYTVLLQKTAEIKAAGHGIAMAHMTKEKMEHLAIPLPPLAEQKRIVAKVDELMALVDALAAGTRAGMEAHETLVRELLATLVNSQDADDLARNWSRIEAYFDTLFTTEESINALRETAVGIALEHTGNPARSKNASRGVVRKQWPIVPLGELIDFGPKNGVSPRAVDFETPVKTLTLTATTSGVFQPEHFKYVDIDVPGEDSELWLRSGDILIQRANALRYVGVSAIYEGDNNEFIYPDLMIKIRFSSQLLPKFGLLVLNSESVRNYFRSNASGTSGSMPKINHKVLRAAPIVVPSIAEQRRIVSQVEALAQLCELTKAAMRDSAKQSLILAETLVTESVA